MKSNFKAFTLQCNFKASTLHKTNDRHDTISKCGKGQKYNWCAIVQVVCMSHEHEATGVT